MTETTVELPIGTTGAPAVVPAAAAFQLVTQLDWLRGHRTSVDQVELWRKHLLNEDPRVSIAALTYLTDRVAGKPSQVLKGDPDNPISITLEWTTRPEWLRAVTLNQHVTHIHAADGAEDAKRVAGGVTPLLDSQKSTP